MKKKLKCLFGFHVWKPITECEQDDSGAHITLILGRICICCGKEVRENRVSNGQSD